MFEAMLGLALVSVPLYALFLVAWTKYTSHANKKRIR